PVNDGREARDHPGYETAEFSIDGALCGHDTSKRHRLNVPDPGRLDAELGKDHVADFCAVVERIHLHARAAFDHGSIEKSFGRGHGEKRGDFLATAGFSENENSTGIAAEIGNVVAHPNERGDNIEHADIAGGLE